MGIIADTITICTMTHPISRRTVMKAAAVVALTPFIRATEPAPPRIGFIGVGARGTVLLRHVLAQGALVPAVCDIDEKNLNRAADLVENHPANAPAATPKAR